LDKKSKRDALIHTPRLSGAIPPNIPLSYEANYQKAVGEYQSLTQLLVRTKAVNNAVRGSKTSQHMKGEAADIECSDNAALNRLIRDFLPFDQLIGEGGDDKQPARVHVSYSTVHNRKQVLRLP